MDKIFIIPHTHWDREWYAQFEEYRWYLVRMLDALLDTFEKDKRFLHFHLDGQTIVLDDYLEIRPQNRARVERLIAEGRLAIGPWYVLQDEFLTSGEANVRNLLFGLRAAEKYGRAEKVGYLPDTFGHFSQMPQLLRGFGIDNAIFCRGLSSAFDAVRCENTSPSDSEVAWCSPDGSVVLGIFGTQWYNNLNELSYDDPAAHIRRAVEDLRGSVKTGNYLLFNGCDHQPLQKNLPEVLARAEKDLSDDSIHWASFSEYLTTVQGSVKAGTVLSNINGELTSQDTDGLFSFVHTASVRHGIKQKNAECQNLLECAAEPISVFAELEGKPYDKQYIDHCWKLLLQNHAHDSICGCGVDPVYREMGVRFEKCRSAVSMIIRDAAKYIADRVDGNGQSILVVFNSGSSAKSDIVTAEVIFSEDIMAMGATVAVEKDGVQLPSHVVSYEKHFCYELPENSFRRGYNGYKATVKFLAKDVPAYGYTSYTLKTIPKGEPQKCVSNEFENEFYSFYLNEDGSFDLKEKASGFFHRGLNRFEDGGNVGNEYTYVAPELDEIVSTEATKAQWSAEENALYRRYTVKHSMSVPIGFEKLEKNAGRQLNYDGSVGSVSDKVCSRRSREKTVVAVKSEITLYWHSSRIEIKTSIDNTAKNHRIRAVFPHAKAEDEVVVHTPFDYVTRAYGYKPNWRLSDMSDRMQAFCGFKGNSSFLLGARGLYEYEAKPDKIYLTLLNAVDEMGDWGDFPTPDAQQPGISEYEYAVLTGSDFESVASDAVDYSQSRLFCVTAEGKGYLPKVKSYFSGCETVIPSALKKSEDGKGYVLRVYNPTQAKKDIKPRIMSEGYFVVECGLNEKKDEDVPTQALAKKIITLKFFRKQTGEKK